MSGSTVVVVGVGYVGKRLVERLANDSTIATAVELGRSSSLNLDTDTSLPIDLAAPYRVLYTVPPSPDHDDDVRLKNFLEMLLQAPDSFTYISTTGVYGDCQGATIDEQSELRPVSSRAKRRVSAESRLREWSTEHNMPLYVLRTPGIYGPGRLGLERIRNLTPLIRENDAHPGNRIHVEDVVSCCVAALRGDAPSGTYNIGDGDHRSPTWFTQEVARQAGLPAPPEISREEAGKLDAESRVVATTRMRDELGVCPKYENAADGIHASLPIR